MKVDMSLNKESKPKKSLLPIDKYPFSGGAHGVMVIVGGNGHSDISSNPGWDWLHFT